MSSGGGAAIGIPKLRTWRAAGQDTNCRRTTLDTGLKGTRGTAATCEANCSRFDEAPREMTKIAEAQG
jgi:hypothetical protein